jgi:hypothetical protein
MVELADTLDSKSSSIMIEFHYLLTKGTTMGDRANFGIKQTNGDTIYVYGHWAGEGMLARFANALDVMTNAYRVGDEAYGSRIIINQLIGSDWNTDLGWGITVNYIADNEHKVPVYDHTTDTVSLYDWHWQTGLGDAIVTFDRVDFINKYAKTLMEV